MQQSDPRGNNFPQTQSIDGGDSFPWDGELAILATPIGNLGDLSPRARYFLAQADWILCEDTRVSRKLMEAIGVEAGSRLVRLDQHASKEDLSQWVRMIEQGKKVALVTDAGTPSVSDPGAELVRAAQDEGLPIVAVPGPSSLAAAISISGLRGDTLEFRGFFPKKEGERKAEIDRIRNRPEAHAVIWFESPHRIENLIDFLCHVCGDFRGFVTKEMTKKNEQYWAGNFEQIMNALSDLEDPKKYNGEWVVGLEWPGLEKGNLNVDPELFERVIRNFEELELSHKQISKRVGHIFGVPSREIYDQLLARKQKS